MTVSVAGNPGERDANAKGGREVVQSLDELLGKKEPEKADEQPQEAKAETPEAETEAKLDKPRDESGKFTKVEEKPVEASPEKDAGTTAAKPAEQKTQPNDPEAGLKAGITAERKKRQEAERRLAEVERKLAEQQQPVTPPDVLADPQGYRDHIQQTVESRLLDQRVDLSVDFASKQHADWNEVMGAEMENWIAAATLDPSLYQRAITQTNPGEWVYQQMKRSKFLDEIGDDPNAWKEAQKAALRAELEAEIKKQQESRQPVPSPSLASASSGGRSTATTWSGPTPLNQLLKR